MYDKLILMFEQRSLHEYNSLSLSLLDRYVAASIGHKTTKLNHANSLVQLLVFMVNQAKSNHACLCKGMISLLCNSLDRYVAA